MPKILILINDKKSILNAEKLKKLLLFDKYNNKAFVHQMNLELLTQIKRNLKTKTMFGFEALDK